MDIAAVRAGLAAKLRTIPRLANRVFETVPDAPEPPAAIVRPAPGTFLRYAQDQSGTVEATFLVTVVESTASTRTGQENIDAYLAPSGPLSVFAAMGSTATGVTDYAVVTEAQNYGEVIVAGVEYVGIDFVVEVSGL